MYEWFDAHSDADGGVLEEVLDGILTADEWQRGTGTSFGAGMFVVVRNTASPGAPFTLAFADAYKPQAQQDVAEARAELSDRRLQRRQSRAAADGYRAYETPASDEQYKRMLAALTLEGVADDGGLVSDAGVKQGAETLKRVRRRARSAPETRKRIGRTGAFVRGARAGAPQRRARQAAVEIPQALINLALEDLHATQRVQTLLRLLQLAPGRKLRRRACPRRVCARHCPKHQQLAPAFLNAHTTRVQESRGSCPARVASWGTPGCCATRQNGKRPPGFKDSEDK